MNKDTSIRELERHIADNKRAISIAVNALNVVGVNHSQHLVMHAYNLGFHNMAYYLDTLLTEQKSLNLELDTIKIGEQVS